jgi:hypothetical protein
MSLKAFKNLFTAHPESINETYLRHLCFASLSGLRLIFAGIACIIHSIFPFLFINTASNVVKKIYEKMDNRKQ